MKLAKAKYLITFMDTNITAFENLPDKLKTFVVQNGRRALYFKAKHKPPKIWYYFAHNSDLKSVIRDAYDCTYVTSGSIANNDNLLAQHIKFEKVQWISQIKK